MPSDHSANDKETGMKRIALIGLTLLALAGCNTIAGVGEDVTDGAHTVKEMF
jgi:predicted small secreted protein